MILESTYIYNQYVLFNSISFICAIISKVWLFSHWYWSNYLIF